jgi:hypothetical protein
MNTFTKEEKAAMRARAKELKEAAEGEAAIKAALAKMKPDDRALGQRIHTLVTETAPDLTPKTWYGMPAYANKNGKVICYFKNAGKFKSRSSASTTPRTSTTARCGRSSTRSRS